MIGYGTALVWGPIADRFGRVRTMMFSIFCFSLFTLLAAFATGIWSLAIFRFMAGVGIGGEWSVGAALVSEDWPEERRTMGAALDAHGLLHRFFSCRLANIFIGSRYGWRSMFALGGAPALLIGLIRNNVEEPARWESKVQELGEKWTMHRAFLKLFSPQYRRRTIVNSMYLIVSLCGPVGRIGLRADGYDLYRGKGRKNRRESARLASYSTALLGDCHGSRRADRALSRRPAGPPGHARDFLCGDDVRDLAGVRPRFLHAAKCHRRGFWSALRCSASEEQILSSTPSGCLSSTERNAARARSRLSPTSDASSAAGFTFLVGAGIRHFQTFGIPVAMTALAFVVGLALIPFGEETKGKPLPA